MPVIESAHNIGAYVITCDYLPGNYAHKFSDEYLNVSIIEKDAVLHQAEKMNIDGIMSFACDPGVVTAAYVAEKMGLPSVGSYEAVSIMQNKGRFRKFLSDNGFNVPYYKVCKNWKDVFDLSDDLQYPVIVKPVDSAGSKGVSKVNCEADLERAYNHAIDYSLMKEVIVEGYLEQTGFASDSDCFSVNGTMVVTTFSAQRFDRFADNPYAPAGFSWPGTISENNRRILSLEIQRLISLLRLGTSIYNIETRECTDGKAYIMECSPRGGGNRLAEMIRHSAGVDMIDASVRAALGFDFKLNNLKIKGNWAEVILYADRSGRFKKLLISNEIKPYVKEIDLWVEYGERIFSFSGANDTIGTIVLCFDNSVIMEKLLQNRRNYIQVIVD